MSSIIEQKGKTLYITLNRPERGNSLDPSTVLELRQTFIDAQENDAVKIIVLTGSGGKDFCTGMDVDFARNLTPENKTNLANLGGDIATLIFYGKPTIIAINGRAMGMGLVFTSAADYRIVVDNAILRMPEVNVGIFPGASCIVIMSRICGIAATRKMLMFGEPFTPAEALKMNLVDEIVSKDTFKPRLDTCIRELSRKNNQVIKAIKLAVNNIQELSYEKGIELETALADYYRREAVDQKLQQIRDQFGLKYVLTGNPELMKKEIASNNFIL